MGGKFNNNKASEEQVFDIIEPNVSNIFHLIALKILPIHFQFYRKHSYDGFVLAKMSFVLFCLCWVFCLLTPNAQVFVGVDLPHDSVTFGWKKRTAQDLTKMGVSRPL